MMTKIFTTREKALLIVLGLLLVFGLYYLFVFMPSSVTISEAQLRIDEIANLMKDEEEKAEEIKRMQLALEGVAGTAAANTYTPIYDNFPNLLEELNSALATADSYDLNFLTPVITEGIATRELQLVFRSGNYYASDRIIGKLYSIPYRCDITSFKLEPTEREATDLTSAPVTATLVIKYYEIVK